MKRPDQTADAQAFIELRDGPCHYRLDGPADGPCVLMIHGATVAHWEFDRLAPYLHAAGWRTLRPDLYGHGYSARPRTAYTHGLFVRQLLDLLDALRIAEPMALVGHSLGGAVAARLAAAAPSRFTRLVMGAPLVDYEENVPSSRLLHWPVLGELLTHAYVVPMLKRRRASRYRPIEDGRFVGKFKRQLAIPGFPRALLSMFRHQTLGDQADAYAALRACGLPTLVLRGDEDPICSAAQIDRLRGWLPEASVEILEGTGHAFMLAEPERVAPQILTFLAAHGREFDAGANVGQRETRSRPRPSICGSR